jgi:pyruvate dehydrogenase E2 component (dihydrolipoamide acetyltransferase)
MPVFITMPSLSPTMEMGNLVKWCKSIGDQIEIGDVVAEIDTDKATMEVEALQKGELSRILVEEGSHNIQVKTPIAVIKQKGDTDKDVEDFVLLNARQSQLSEKGEITKNSATYAAVTDRDDSLVTTKKGDKILASPLAKRIALEYGIDLNTILGGGSGPGGRIIKNDVLEYCESLPHNNNNMPPPSETIFTEERASSLRMVIAEKLTKSKQEVPHFYMSVTANVSMLSKILTSLKNSPNLDVKITANEFVVKAIAMVMSQMPQINSTWNSDGIIKRYDDVDISIAVAVKGGIYSPVIRNADKKSLKEIGMEIRSLAEKCKNNTIKSIEYTGGGITVSNLGMIDIDSFFSIINPPQASIISVPRIMKRPIVDDNDNIVVGYTLTIGYAIDHRIIDGMDAALFLSRIKQILENPIQVFIL